MEDFEFLMESREFFEFLEENRERVLDAGFESVREAFDAGFLFDAFLNEVTA